MTNVRALYTALGIALSSLLANPIVAQPSKLSDAQAAVLQTDGPRASALFGKLLQNPGPLSLWDLRRTKCSITRLAGKSSVPLPAFSGDPLADRIIGIYRSYWQQAVDPARRERAEAQLFRDLRRAIQRADLIDRDAVLDAVSAQLKARNIYTTLGKTATLYDLLLYLQEEEQSHKVALTDGTSFDVKVFLMRSVVSYGWARYFNCGGPGIGGFATDEGLYAIAETYDLDSEDFLVRFLSHETRHFADYRRYPGLEGPELEYRAKLTELALLDRTLNETLKLFEGDQGDDRATPHSHANKRVLVAIRRQLGLAPDADLRQVDLGRLHEAARALLIEDNRQRDSAKR